MHDTDQPAAAPRGRPSTGKALSTTERTRQRRARLALQGKRILGSVTISAEAAQALARLTAGGALTIDQAVSRALVQAAGAAGTPSTIPE